MHTELTLPCEIVSKDCVEFRLNVDNSLSVEVYQDKKSRFVELDTASIAKLQTFLDYFWEVQIDKI